MPEVLVPVPGGMLPAHVARPSGPEPAPGVVVLHDVAGMSTDVRRQADWLAGAGLLAAAPDFLDGWGPLRCLRSVVHDVLRRQGPIFDRIEATRRWVAEDPVCTGRVGIVGFCVGGDFALLLAPQGRVDAVSVNYGRVPRDAARLLRGSCPVVGSYGGRDRPLRGAAQRLETALERAGVAHDVTEYPDAGHAFLNDHAPGEVPAVFSVLGRVSNAGYHGAAAEDARRRIVSFLRQHLA